MGFQGLCGERLSQVMLRHGRDVSFKHVNGDPGPIAVVFEFDGRTHEIGIYEDTVNMREGKSLFECYMTEEFESELALIEGFATRLDRYLSGGPWEGPDETGLPDLIKGSVKRFFRWLLSGVM